MCISHNLNMIKKLEEELNQLNVDFLFNSIFKLIEYNYPQFKWVFDFNKKVNNESASIMAIVIHKTFKLIKPDIYIGLNIEKIKKRIKIACNIHRGDKLIAYKEFSISKPTLEEMDGLSVEIFSWIKKNLQDL